jgi:hypothetical protein
MIEMLLVFVQFVAKGYALNAWMPKRVLLSVKMINAEIVLELDNFYL